MITLDSFDESTSPSSKSNSHDLFCFANNCLWSLLANFVTKFCRLVSCWSKFFLSLIISSSFSKSFASFTSSYSLVNILYFSLNFFLLFLFCKLVLLSISFSAFRFKSSFLFNSFILSSAIFNSDSLCWFSSSLFVEFFSSSLFWDWESSFFVSFVSSLSLESESSKSRLLINSDIISLNLLWFSIQLSRSLNFF